MLAAPATRMLKKADAARYCGLDVTAFKRECPVAPVKFGEETYRYDRQALDQWLDRLGNGAELSGDEWLGKLDEHGG